MTRVIESCARVLVVGMDAHLLQYDLDGDGVASIVLCSISRVCQVAVKDGSNSGCRVARHYQ